ncbi:hypothetical protein PaYy2_132 [Pseudomonas phage PaYy-2]|uniref:Uncharacterized protein n=1 Tax=Pseudomonas phage Henu5 TaxID=2499902 RepID=A0A410T8A8_9CAUD|nr:hypothetical protein AU075_gp138 [Pseudomonas phage C11]YP_010762974.1 hypothetical protein QE327_gp130 [Pseudomonas phage Henu5]ALJ97542.1 hypothetical protein C11_082 [Pseudomonas phage C11]AXY86926.1 hypothetical protein PaYy2_132 [Pseudomonas phage PaYy-2]QAU05163.1 hypothetical protein Henu5_gp137 [Pseudomonas phage Henu5]
MELSDVKKGQVVMVGSLDTDMPRPTFEKTNARTTGVVVDIDSASMHLNVKVLFDNGAMDWGNATDMKLLHSGPEANKVRKKLAKKVIQKLDELFDEVYQVVR